MTTSRRPPRIAAALAALLLVVVTACQRPAATDVVEVGRRIYEEGVLPDGSPLVAIRPEGFEMRGAYAACAVCHRRSGMGTVEGSIDATVLVPPVAGPLLFAPARFHGRFLDDYHHWVPNEAWARALTRDAYDGRTLARALRSAVDPDGRALVAPMPRYALDDGAIEALSAYLRELAAQPAPGVDEDALHLATVVGPDAEPDEAERVLGVLRAWAASTRASGRPWILHEWRLDAGDAAAQLEALHRERPVFAVLSGSGRSRWEPVHAFCEAHAIPCVLPAIEVAPTTPGLYPVYWSPGVRLEARILARALAGDDSPARVVQVVSDDSGAAAAQALEASLDGTPIAVETRRFRWTAPAAALSGLAPDDALVLWLRAPEVSEVAAQAARTPLPARRYLSAILAPPEATVLAEGWRSTTVWVSLYDDLGVQGELARLRLRRWLERQGLGRSTPETRAEADAYGAAYLLAEALYDIRQQEVRRPPVPLGREHVLETLERHAIKYADGTELVDPEGHVAFYGRMSLGPDQRVAVRGGRLVRLDPDGGDRLVFASPRLVP